MEQLVDWRILARQIQLGDTLKYQPVLSRLVYLMARVGTSTIVF